MSGICGFTGMGEESILRNMFNQISNSETFIPFSNKSVSFCGNSLTVSDNSANSKIISNENESVFLAFDGEIYNYKDLRDELITLGHTFKSESQHEVVVHLYEEAGQNAFGRINGIFSAVLWDENRDELFLFIDKLGIKQIFFTFCDDVFLFGSAMKTIIQYPDFKRELDEITLNHFLTLEFTPTERTLIKGISRLQPGHFLVYRQGKVTVSHYWNFSIGVNNEPEDFYIRTLRRLFEESVRKSTADCHTIGALLSGGMDSSALVALLHTVSDKPIKTFSVYLGEESSTDRDSDWKYARLVAERFGTDHHEMVLDDLVLDRLPYFIWINEGPGMSLVPLLMRESVKKHVDVVFTGRGLDEILGGQGRFAKIRYINLAGKMHKFVPKLVPALFADIIELPRSLLVEHIPECDRYLRYLNILPSFGNKTFFYSSIIPGYVRTDKRFLYAPALSHTRAENTNELFSPYFSKDGDILNEMLLAESKTRLSAILLNFDHKISNYIGLIERAPLADPDIVTFSFTIPSHLKVRNNCTKYILRKTMSDVLPKEIIHRKKAGGYVPKSYVLLTKTDLREKIISTLPEWNLIKNGYIREDYFHNILSRPASPKLNRQYKLILYLLSLEIWYNIFIAPKTACKPVSDKIETYLGTRG